MRDRVIKRIISTIAKFKQLHCERSTKKTIAESFGRNSLTIYQHPKQQTSIRISHMEEEEGLLMRFFKDGANEKSLRFENLRLSRTILK